MFLSRALKLISEVLLQFGLSTTTSELTATARMQLEMDSRLHYGFQSFQRPYTLSNGTCPIQSYVKLAANASAYGLGAVISHIFPDGSEHPIAFASRILIPSGGNYAQMVKEVLALGFGVQHFQQ